MAYSGGCIIGVEVPLIANKTLSVTAYAVDGALSLYTKNEAYAFAKTDYNSPPWQLMDGSLTPKKALTSSGAPNYGMGAMCVPVIAANDLPYRQGLFVVASPPEGKQWYSGSWAAAPRCFGAAASGDVTIRDVTVTSLYAQMVNQIDWNPLENPVKALLCDYEDQSSWMTDFYVGFGVANGMGCQWGEACPVRYIETPNNAELTSLRYQLRDEKKQTLVTLDGVHRVTSTGTVGAEIAATFKWSDDGTTANRLQQLFYIAQMLCRPLVIWLPAGIYYSGSLLELVYTSAPPVITMPAPALYEVTIEGVCQP